MLSLCLVVVAVLNSSHGFEGTREEKLRGALLADTSTEGRGSSSTLEAQSNLPALRASRPSFEPSITVLAVGGVVTLLGLAAAGLTLVSLAALNEGGVWFLVVSAGIAGVGVVLGVIGGLAMAIVGAELTRVDARIRQLEEAGPLRAPTALFSVPPRLVLARF